MDSENEVSFPCNECPAGQLHHQLVTYFTWLGDELITVPSFPAWVCDVCGRREYDSRAVSRLNLLLNPNAGRSSSAAAARRSRPTPKSPPPPLK